MGVLASGLVYAHEPRCRAPEAKTKRDNSNEKNSSVKKPLRLQEEGNRRDGGAGGGHNAVAGEPRVLGCGAAAAMGAPGALNPACVLISCSEGSSQDRIGLMYVSLVWSLSMVQAWGIVLGCMIWRQFQVDSVKLSRPQLGYPHSVHTVLTDALAVSA